MLDLLLTIFALIIGVVLGVFLGRGIVIVQRTILRFFFGDKWRELFTK